VVGLIEATSSVYEDHSEPDTRYADGRKTLWKWKADAEIISTSGFISRIEALKILGYSPNYTFRGYGKAKSGLNCITKKQFEALLAEFKSTDSEKAPLITAAKKDLSKEKIGGKWSGRKGGEGKEHLNLKNYIANNLETVFNEEGVQVIEVEYTFSSGDRADILLKDRYGRVIGLEVETEVKGDAYGMAGVLQAIKYRFMGALTEKVSYADSRSFLVAYSISPKVKEICKKYEVETIEVSKEVVINWAK